ncbi:MAG: hypothetical protein AUJ21_06520 [Anaerolineae bacterium CG1_02_58_13]|nr:MAG: hypothetical protein AUJ21_06520 [Anaerolineae bacterium CG1_02_58_13]
MLVRHHIAITRQAIGADVSPRALEVIVRANLRQDGLRCQFGHARFHFDNNQFDQSYAYIEEQRALVRASLQRGDAQSAWRAFGRMIHTAQDFYAHSDYIPRWLSRFNYSPRSEAERDGGTPPPPPEVDPVSPDIFHDPGLRSGKLYYPLEALAFIPFLKKLILPLLPSDSHAHMNFDDRDDKGLFDHVFHASVKRTRLEFEKTAALLSPNVLAQFIDR